MLSQELSLAPTAQALLTFIPPSPPYPPKSSSSAPTHTTIPGLVVNEPAGAGHGTRVAFLPADPSTRRFAMDNFPDHGNLLANLTRWAAKDNIPLAVQGPGLLDCSLYRQQNRLILHLLNLTSAASWRAPIHEFIPIGPLQISLKLPDGIAAKTIKTRVSNQTLSASTNAGTLHFELKSILDHELVIIE